MQIVELKTIVEESDMFLLGDYFGNQEDLFFRYMGCMQSREIIAGNECDNRLNGERPLFLCYSFGKRKQISKNDNDPWWWRRKELLVFF